MIFEQDKIGDYRARLQQDLLEAAAFCAEVYFVGDRLCFQGSRADEFAKRFEARQGEGLRNLVNAWMPNLVSEKTNEPPEPTLAPGVSLLDQYRHKLSAGNLPQLLAQHSALDGLEVGFGLLTILGAPPGAGKTALASQIAFDATELDNSLTVYISNAEMDFESLMRRQLAKITRIDSNKIRFGDLDDAQRSQVLEAVDAIRPKLEQFKFFTNPSIDSLVELLDRPPGLVVVDYLQKFSPADRELRVGVNQVCNLLRDLARHGHAVLALSATKRDSRGKHSSAELTLASFKESGEIEFNADSCYVLADNGPVDDGCEYIRRVTLAHLKNRHGGKVDRDLEFHMPRMQFTSDVSCVDVHGFNELVDDEHEFVSTAFGSVN